ncbi:hypothetical protein B9479_002028 [Cryptococcus floricola]|uniref:Uncharacterized protein n=1 Tax=Cryptococcus floricola TaxID=2591691 RepID=A0A5D3B0Z9_9TREE|nr:hypothetical protein B9479_002028 [Cryptococcus floricola]
MEKPNYIGIYAPGDFAFRTYRIVFPVAPGSQQRGGRRKPKRGRGYRGWREEVVLETEQRSDINALLNLISDLAKDPEGPIATRHIVNPSQAKDEGVRLIWADDGEKGEEEMRDWPRREQMRKEGKTVRGQDDAMVLSMQAAISSDGSGMGAQWQTLESSSWANRVFWADSLTPKSPAPAS